jgi:hypothetical protein
LAYLSAVKTAFGFAEYQVLIAMLVQITVIWDDKSGSLMAAY